MVSQEPEEADSSCLVRRVAKTGGQIDRRGQTFKRELQYAVIDQRHGVSRELARDLRVPSRRPLLNVLHNPWHNDYRGSLTRTVDLVQYLGRWVDTPHNAGERL